MLEFHSEKEKHYFDALEKIVNDTSCEGNEGRVPLSEGELRTAQNSLLKKISDKDWSFFSGLSSKLLDSEYKTAYAGWVLEFKKYCLGSEN